MDWQGLVALIGVILVALGACGINAGRVSLVILGAAFLAIALFWSPLAHLFNS